MRYFKTILAWAVVGFLAVTTFAEQEAADSPKQFITDWVAAFHKEDPKQLLAFYDPSEELEVVISAGVRHHGYQALQKAYADDFKSVRFYDSTPKDITTRILGDTALVTFEHLFKVRFRGDDSRWQVHVRTTTVLHRIDGKWKIVLEHSSPISGIERYARIDD